MRTTPVSRASSLAGIHRGVAKQTFAIPARILTGPPPKNTIGPITFHRVEITLPEHDHLPVQSGGTRRDYRVLGQPDEDRRHTSHYRKALRDHREGVLYVRP